MLDLDVPSNRSSEMHDCEATKTQGDESMIRRIAWMAGLLVCAFSYASLAPIMMYGDVAFPNGDVAFADRVTEYVPASCVTEDCDDPREALGPPDAGCPSCDICDTTGTGRVFLGSRISEIDDRGILVIEFTDNVLTDVEGDDLYIFITNSKPVDVEISVDGVTFLAVGRLSGCPASVDIGPLTEPGAEFRFVRMIDVANDEERTVCSGASIDAVGAMGPEIEVIEGEVSGGIELQPLGTLLVETPSASNVFLILFDTTSSMDLEIDGERKIDIARNALTDFLDRLPEETVVGFRSFASCGHNRLISALDDPLSIAEIKAEILLLEPGGATPLAYTIEQASEDCGCIDGPKTMILISDGIETCQGDPLKAARALVNAEENLTAHVVGFNAGESITDRAQLVEIAETLGGQYHDAEDAAELEAVLRVVGAYPYTLFDSEGEIVFEGRTGDGGPRDLAAGTYRLVVDSTPELVVEEIAVSEEGITSIILEIVNGQLTARVTTD